VALFGVLARNPTETPFTRMLTSLPESISYPVTDRIRSEDDPEKVKSADSSLAVTPLNRLPYEDSLTLSKVSCSGVDEADTESSKLVIPQNQFGTLCLNSMELVPVTCLLEGIVIELGPVSLFGVVVKNPIETSLTRTRTSVEESMSKPVTLSKRSLLEPENVKFADSLLAVTPLNWKPNDSVIKSPIGIEGCDCARLAVDVDTRISTVADRSQFIDIAGSGLRRKVCFI